MSLLPLLFSNWWEDLDRPHQILDQDFGVELRPDQILICPHDLMYPRLYGRPLRSYHVRPWGELMRRGAGGASTVKSDKNKFQVMLDVQQFSPDEISVKVVDKHVVVEARHEEKKDEHGWISRQFVRKYMIPEQCDIEQVSSSLSSDGVLAIVAPRKQESKIEGERIIKVEHTGKPTIKGTENGDAEPEEKMENKQ